MQSKTWSSGSEVRVRSNAEGSAVALQGTSETEVGNELDITSCLKGTGFNPYIQLCKALPGLQPLRERWFSDSLFPPGGFNQQERKKP
jgi:hypothetical protein